MRRSDWDASLDHLIFEAHRADYYLVRMVGVKAEEEDTEPEYFIWVGGTCDVCAPRNGNIYRWGVDPAPPLHPNCRCRAVPYMGEVPDAEPKPDIFERPDGVPENWLKTASNKGEGVRYRDPRNLHNEVRVQKGKPEVSNPLQ